MNIKVAEGGTLEYSKAYGLDKLLAYQEGAVISRQMAGTSGGTVTMFAFDAGQGLSEHTAPFDAMVIVIDGEVDIFIEGTPTRVKAGEVFIMPAGKPHALEGITQFKMLLVMLKNPK